MLDEINGEAVSPYDWMNDDLSDLVKKMHEASSDEGNDGKFAVLDEIYAKYRSFDNRDDRNMFVIELTEEAFNRFKKVDPKAPLYATTRDQNDPSPKRNQYFIELNTIVGEIPKDGEPDVYLFSKHPENWKERGFKTPYNIHSWTSNYRNNKNLGDIGPGDILGIKTGISNQPRTSLVSQK